MNGSELNDRLRRLQDICLEAREIIADIEEYVKANNEYSRTSVSVLELPKKHFRTRFLNTCSCLDIMKIFQILKELHYGKRTYPERQVPLHPWRCRP